MITIQPTSWCIYNGTMLSTVTLSHWPPHFKWYIKWYIYLFQNCQPSNLNKTIFKISHTILDCTPAGTGWSMWDGWLSPWLASVQWGNPLKGLKINHPGWHDQRLKEFIESYKFPNLAMHTLITSLWKITAQCIVARCHTLISIQPIKNSDTLLLDKQITGKDQSVLGFPYHGNMEILTLTTSWTFHL